MTDYIMMFTLPGRLTYYRELIPPLKATEIFSGFLPRKINRMLETQEAFIMPSKNTKTGKSRSGFTTTFVNYKLAGKERDQFATFFSMPVEHHAECIVIALNNGIKLSFSDNREAGIVVAAATMRDEGNINYDRCITSRSPDWYEALLMCVFKAQLLGYGEDWLDMAGDDNWG